MSYKLVAPKAGRWSNYRVRGTEFGVYVDRSTKTGDRKIAQRILNEWKSEARHQSLSPHKVKGSFADAAIAYMHAGGEKRFLANLLRNFGERPLHSISQADVDAAALAIYPLATAATRNRQVYSPMSAILKRAGMPATFKRPKGSQGTPRTAWLRPDEAMRLLDAAEAVEARFGALCVFLLYTGCRLSEALRLKWSDVNLEEGFAYVGRTKNGEPRAVHLPPTLRDCLAHLPKKRLAVFSLSKCGRLYGMLARAFQNAALAQPDGVAFHVMRHTWASWMRRYAGLDTTGLVATGAWKSRQAAAVYEHADVSAEARKADMLPVRKK